MPRPVLAASLFCALMLGHAAHATEPVIGSELGTTLDAISASLRAEGFTIIEYEREHNRHEVEAIRDNRRYEIDIDAATGLVTAVEDRRRLTSNPMPGMDEVAFRALLAELGYEVVAFERDRREIEVEATRDGRLWDLELDPDTGEIRHIDED